MKKSIITKDMESCYFCGRPREAIHHVYPGTARRKISDREGFVVPLCAEHHNMSDYSVHFNSQLGTLLKRVCQAKYETLGHSREEFIELIGRNYLGDEE